MKALRVLVVEDDLIIGQLLGEMLAGLGYDVCAIEATETGAVQAALAFYPDLMIVDAQLRDGSGVSAIAEILRSRSIPYLLMSGERVQTDRPGTVVLQKPFREADLVQAIQRALGTTAAVV